VAGVLVNRLAVVEGCHFVVCSMCGWRSLLTVERPAAPLGPGPRPSGSSRASGRWGYLGTLRRGVMIDAPTGSGWWWAGPPDRAVDNQGEVMTSGADADARELLAGRLVDQ
jgi:hypothetical protein